jgi:hypothetical protein
VRRALSAAVTEALCIRAEQIAAMVIVADVIGPVWWSIAPDAADGADGILEIRVHPDDPTASAALPTKGNGDAQGPQNALRAKEAIEAWGRGADEHQRELDRKVRK